MKLDSMIINELNQRIENMKDDNTYSLINKLKDLYVSIIKDGYVDENTYLELAAIILYVGLLNKE